MSDERVRVLSFEKSTDCVLCVIVCSVQTVHVQCFEKSTDAVF